MGNMENNILHKKDPFPKTVSDIFRVLAGWKNKFNSKYNRFSEGHHK